MRKKYEIKKETIVQYNIFYKKILAKVAKGVSINQACLLFGISKIVLFKVISSVQKHELVCYEIVYEHLCHVKRKKLKELWKITTRKKSEAELEYERIQDLEAERIYQEELRKERIQSLIAMEKQAREAKNIKRMEAIRIRKEKYSREKERLRYERKQKQEAIRIAKHREALDTTRAIAENLENLNTLDTTRAIAENFTEQFRPRPKIYSILSSIENPKTVNKYGDGFSLDFFWGLSKAYFNEVEREALLIRECATESEKANLNPKTLYPLEPTTCLYGQLTGYGRSERWRKMIVQLGHVFLTEQIFDPSASFNRIYWLENQSSFISHFIMNYSGKIFTPLEHFINLKPEHKQQIISYIKRDIQTLTLNIQESWN